MREDVCLPVTCTASNADNFTKLFSPAVVGFLFVKDLLAFWTLEEGYSLESRWVDTGHCLILHVVLL